MSRDPPAPSRPGPGLHCTEHMRLRARRRLPRMIFDFLDGAAGRESSAALNESALREIRLQPRVLRNVMDRNLGGTFLGLPMGLPFGFAPMGMCNLTWPGADLAMAAEAKRRGLVHCLSTAASTALEEVGQAAGGRAWFQLYVGPSMEQAMALVDRAEAAGYEVLILTVDVPHLSRRLRDLRNGFKVPFQIGPRQALDFALHPHWSLAQLAAGVPSPAHFEIGIPGRGFVRGESRGGIDWAFLDRLRARWKGKLVVKGVMHPEDAMRIRDAGADALYVSNHGGRQLDAAPAAISALPQIRAAVGPDTPLIFDSGIRNGEDIVKALALGADLVMLGRTAMYAIGADGARGLSTLVGLLEEEISATLAQIGLTSVSALGPDVLVHPAKGDTP